MTDKPDSTNICSTEPTPPVEPGMQQTAEELALLTILSDRVKAELDKRRVLVQGWAPKTTIAVVLPNASIPSRPHAVGTIRADGGQGVARISDKAAWIAWCRENVPHNVVDQAAGSTSWPLDVASRGALEAAHERATEEEGKRFAPDVARIMLDVLEAAGFTLARRQLIAADTIVRPAWEAETLKMTQAVGEPVAPGGMIPEGVEYAISTAPIKPVVTIGKNDEVRNMFVAEHRARLAEITGRITNEETP